jgi:hypothetical protein
VIRSFGDTTIYVAIALFTLAWIGFYLFRDRFELAPIHRCFSDGCADGLVRSSDIAEVAS